MKQNIILFNNKQAAQDYVKQMSERSDLSCDVPHFDENKAKWIVVVQFWPVD